MCVTLIKTGKGEVSTGFDKMPDSGSNNHHPKNVWTLPEYDYTGIG